MDFSTITDWIIKEGNVVKVVDSLSRTIWEKSSGPDYSTPLTLTNTYASTNTLNLFVNKSVSTVPNIEYSLDNGVTWKSKSLAKGSSNTISSIASGASVMLRGTNTSGYSQSSSYFNRIYMDNSFTVSGNLLSIVDYENMETLTEIPSYCFYQLFYNATNLTDASGLNLGKVKTLGLSSLNGLFYNCTSLTAPFDMGNIETIGMNACYNMYYQNTRLISVPNMSKVSYINERGCTGMFQWCTSLTESISLPKLASAEVSAFSSVFSNCTSIVTPIKVPLLTTVPSSCFYFAYYNCTALKECVDFTNVTSTLSSAFEYMYRACTSLEKPSEFPNLTSIEYLAFSYMYYDCTSLKVGPKLSHITSVGNSGCYDMFYNCKNLETVYTPNVATWNSSNEFYNWVYGAGSSATTPIMYVPSQEVADIIPSGTSGYGNYTVKVIS